MHKRIEQTLDSREVAGMVEKKHYNLMRDIKVYVDELGKLNFEFSDFFRESTYRTDQNKVMPCYGITKKGCEFIAHKLTGIKGTEFTAKYINRFHDMQEVIENHAPQGKELLALAVLEAQKLIEEKDKQITEMQPKALFADSVAGSDTSILIRDLAKILRQNGVDIGGNRLFEWLREKGYLIKQRGSDWNMPTQMAMNRELFEIKQTIIHHADKPSEIKKTPKVTGKGQNYFVNKFLSGKMIV